MKMPYEQAAALWVARKYQAAPEIGSVEFDFGHDWSGEWRLRVEWRELTYLGPHPTLGPEQLVTFRSLYRDEQAADEDTLIREIFEIGQEGAS